MVQIIHPAILPTRGTLRQLWQGCKSPTACPGNGVNSLWLEFANASNTEIKHKVFPML